ncbi:hypothetical protein Lal_00017068 [Lupinus albus]|nr:hypothetical protein Lal_00017068 [Lupinus albus]
MYSTWNDFHKRVIRARSKNVMLPIQWNTKGQLLNMKGGNTLVSYIGVVVRQNVPTTFSSWINVRLNRVKEHIWNDIATTFDIGEEHKDYILKSVGKALQQKLSDENHKRVFKILYPYRASRAGYRGIEEKIVAQTKRYTFEYSIPRCFVGGYP